MPTGWMMVAAFAAGQGEYRPGFDPSRLKRPAAEAPNELMVLGTPHLSGIAASTELHLAPLLDRLAAWRPRMVMIEALSGMQCEQLRLFPHRYAESVKSYCRDTAPAKAATGLDVPAATAEAARLLASSPADPTSAQRRRLAATFLAAGERGSALVQWLRLPPAERRAGDLLDAPLVALLEQLRTTRNENYLIAAPLAARLGLERLHAVDDHSADFAPADEAGFAAAMARIWNNPAVAQRTAADARLSVGMGTGEGLLALYRGYNAPDMARLVYDSDFGAALADRSPAGHGRAYLGYWETRNLRMVANIRDALAQAPGTRAIAIVGVSHKGYYEAYLAAMHDVQLVDTAAVLR